MLKFADDKLSDLTIEVNQTSSQLEQMTSTFNVTQKKLCSTRNSLNEKRKKLKNLRKRANRYKKKNCDLRKIILELKKRSFLADEYADMLENLSKTSYALFQRQLLKSSNPKLVKIYDERLRAFSITLNFLSPKAYDFVRDQFDTCLPHRRTIGRWYTTVNASAGFSNEVLRVLRDKCKEEKLIFALMFDGMAIRKRIDWDGSKFFGYVDFGYKMDNEEAPRAQEAIVFHLVGVNTAWKLPLGYFLINSITGEQLYNLTCVALESLRKIGVTITSITCDGESHNLTMLKKMGCDLSDPTNITCKINVEGHEIFVFLDPCHLLKLVRNTLHDFSCLIDENGNEIKWEYFNSLHQLQITEGLKLGNKLSNSHIFYKNQKMKVKLASQLLSDSVGDALQYCLIKNIDGFESCKGTIRFVKLFNKLFDVLNSRNMRARGTKQALNPWNIDEVKSFLTEAKMYLLELKCAAGRSILVSRRKLGFLGFLLCIESTLGFYQMYVEDQKILKYFPTYKISQDHIERLFSYIRARGGRNNNPSCKEFTYTFRAILVHKQLHETTASSGNVIPLDKINILGVGPHITSCPVENINETCLRKRMLIEDATEIGKFVLFFIIFIYYYFYFLVYFDCACIERQDLQNEEEVCLALPSKLELSMLECIDVEDSRISSIARDIVEYIAGKNDYYVFCYLLYTQC